MRVSVYRVQYFVLRSKVIGRETVETARIVQPTVLVAAKNNVEAARLLPTPAPVAGEESRNVVISCQEIHRSVICADRLTLDEELAKVEAT